MRCVGGRLGELLRRRVTARTIGGTAGPRRRWATLGPWALAAILGHLRPWRRWAVDVRGLQVIARGGFRAPPECHRAYVDRSAVHPRPKAL